MNEEGTIDSASHRALKRLDELQAAIISAKELIQKGHLPPAAPIPNRAGFIILSSFII
jgi:hypothetical protein